MSLETGLRKSDQYISVDDSNMNNLQEQEIAFDNKYRGKFAVKSPLMRECLAECIGTFILVAFGDGVIAQAVVSDSKAGDFTTICICWGLAVTIGIHFSGGVSGAHLNPAVSVALAFFKRLEWFKVVPYVVAQTVGAFFASLVIFLVYYSGLNLVDPGRTLKTAGIFATYPQDHVSTFSAFLSEMVGTAFLLGGIFAISDKLNKPASPYSAPIAVGIIIAAIGFAFGWNTGFAINPARDFGPRLFTAIFGWGGQVFTARSGYFWVPIVAPLVGGIVGAGTYLLFVENHHPKGQNPANGA